MKQKLVNVSISILIVFTIVNGQPLPKDEAPDTGEEMEKLAWRRENKKRTDVFLSRGWGAGGMPFNVLYTQTPKVARPIVGRAVFAAEPPYPSEPQPLRSVRPDQTFKYPRRQYSVIPQLFVSYGWGPVGKK